MCLPSCVCVRRCHHCLRSHSLLASPQLWNMSSRDFQNPHLQARFRVQGKMNKSASSIVRAIAHETCKTRTLSYRTIGTSFLKRANCTDFLLKRLKRTSGHDEGRLTFEELTLCYEENSNACLPVSLNSFRGMPRKMWKYTSRFCEYIAREEKFQPMSGQANFSNHQINLKFVAIAKKMKPDTKIFDIDTAFSIFLTPLALWLRKSHVVRLLFFFCSSNRQFFLYA